MFVSKDLTDNVSNGFYMSRTSFMYGDLVVSMLLKYSSGFSLPTGAFSAHLVVGDARF